MTANSDNNRDEARWLFKAKALRETPSIICQEGMSEQDELVHRQLAAGLIRQIGSKLRETIKRPSGLCMDTAMVFMHRFYMYHSFQKYPANTMAPCALFLAAKCEETPIKIEYVIRTSYIVNYPKAQPLTTTDKEYEKLLRELIANENLLLQTLGFELIIYHPHTSVVQCGELIGVSKAVIKLAYELATNSLHFTTMCLKYKPTTVACICLHMAFKTNQLAIQPSIEGRHWWTYLDPNLNEETITDITNEFLAIIEKNKKSFNKWLSVKNQQPESVDSKSGGRNTIQRPSTSAQATTSNSIN